MDKLKQARLNANQFGREIFYAVFGCESRMQEAIQKSISKERLEVFLKNPQTHGPNDVGERMDLTGATLEAMKASPWNQTLIHRLATKATSMVSHLAGSAQYDIEMISWHKFFESRIYRMLREAYKLRERKDGDDDGDESHSNSVRYSKYHTRLGIAAAMHQQCREDANAQEQEFWSFVLRSVAELTPAGMSDEEAGSEDEEGEKVKFVHDVNFRHPDFRRLFERVDNTRAAEPAVFVQTGRKRMRRVPSTRVIEGTPPSGLSPVHFRPEYLDAMRRGEKPMVKLGLEDYLVSRFVSDEGTAKKKRELAATPIHHRTIIHSTQSPKYPFELNYAYALCLAMAALLFCCFLW